MANGGRNGGDIPDDHSDKIDKMAQALIDLFGDRALEVSEHQANSGDIDSVVRIWREIVEKIKAARR